MTHAPARWPPRSAEWNAEMIFWIVHAIEMAMLLTV